jgi:hypothetical protein
LVGVVERSQAHVDKAAWRLTIGHEQPSHQAVDTRRELDRLVRSAVLN